MIGPSGAHSRRPARCSEVASSKKWWTSSGRGCGHAELSVGLEDRNLFAFLSPSWLLALRPAARVTADRLAPSLLSTRSGQSGAREAVQSRPSTVDMTGPPSVAPLNA